MFHQVALDYFLITCQSSERSRLFCSCFDCQFPTFVFVHFWHIANIQFAGTADCTFVVVIIVTDITIKIMCSSNVTSSNII